MLNLKGSEEWSPDEARQAAELSDVLGIPAENLRLAMPPDTIPVTSYADLRVARAESRGELFFGSQQA